MMEEENHRQQLEEMVREARAQLGEARKLLISPWGALMAGELADYDALTPEQKAIIVYAATEDDDRGAHLAAYTEALHHAENLMGELSVKAEATLEQAEEDIFREGYQTIWLQLDDIRERAPDLKSSELFMLEDRVTEEMKQWQDVYRIFVKPGQTEKMIPFLFAERDKAEGIEQRMQRRVESFFPEQQGYTAIDAFIDAFIEEHHLQQLEPEARQLLRNAWVGKASEARLLETREVVRHGQFVREAYLRPKNSGEAERIGKALVPEAGGYVAADALAGQLIGQLNAEGEAPAVPEEHAQLTQWVLASWKEHGIAETLESFRGEGAYVQQREKKTARTALRSVLHERVPAYIATQGYVPLEQFVQGLTPKRSTQEKLAQHLTTLDDSIETRETTQGIIGYVKPGSIDAVTAAAEAWLEQPGFWGSIAARFRRHKEESVPWAAALQQPAAAGYTPLATVEKAYKQENYGQIPQLAAGVAPEDAVVARALAASANLRKHMPKDVGKSNYRKIWSGFKGQLDPYAQNMPQDERVMRIVQDDITVLEQFKKRTQQENHVPERTYRNNFAGRIERIVMHAETMLEKARAVSR